MGLPKTGMSFVLGISKTVQGLPKTQGLVFTVDVPRLSLIALRNPATLHVFSKQLSGYDSD